MKHSIESSTSSAIIVKDMSLALHGCLDYLPSAAANFKYIFIIRNPCLVATSYRKATIDTWLQRGILDEADAATFDLRKGDRYYRSEGGSFKIMSTVWKHVRENLDRNAMIIDTEDLVANPKPYLRKICEVGGTEYHDGLLEWDSSSEITKRWESPGKDYEWLTSDVNCFHDRAINSSCFVARNGSEERPQPSNNLTEDIVAAVNEGTEYYNEMFKQRFVPNDWLLTVVITQTLKPKPKKT